MRSAECITLFVLALLGSVNLGAAEAPAFDTENFGYDFERSEVDFKNDTAQFFGHVRVTQGPNSIQAEEAIAHAFRSANKQWEFHEAVLVRTAEAQLSAETATAAFENNVLVQARVEGSPAHFESLPGVAEQLARGRARAIEYDVRADTITFTGDVWFGYGADEWRGEQVIYNLRDQRVRMSSGESGRVRGTIRPQGKGNQGDTDPGQPESPNNEANSSGGEGEA